MGESSGGDQLHGKGLVKACISFRLSGSKDRIKKQVALT